MLDRFFWANWLCIFNLRHNLIDNLFLRLRRRASTLESCICLTLRWNNSFSLSNFDCWLFDRCLWSLIWGLCFDRHFALNIFLAYRRFFLLQNRWCCCFSSGYMRLFHWLNLLLPFNRLSAWLNSSNLVYFFLSFGIPGRVCFSYSILSVNDLWLFLFYDFSALVLCHFRNFTILIGRACILSVIVLGMRRSLIFCTSVVGAPLVSDSCLRVLEGRTLLFLNHTDLSCLGSSHYRFLSFHLAWDQFGRLYFELDGSLERKLTTGKRGGRLYHLICRPLNQLRSCVLRMPCKRASRLLLHFGYLCIETLRLIYCISLEPV